MKLKRHEKILEIINEKPITTQEELVEELNRVGFKVTQATVSRDIKELLSLIHISGQRDLPKAAGNGGHCAGGAHLKGQCCCKIKRMLF